MTTRRPLVISLAAIIALGMLSRMVHTGWIVLDKYLGDALYATMFYVILRLLWLRAATRAVAIAAMTIITALEFFQLTLIPLQMLASGNPIIRLTARLLGTEFSFLDLLAYAVGITCVWWLDLRQQVNSRQ